MLPDPVNPAISSQDTMSPSFHSTVDNIPHFSTASLVCVCLTDLAINTEQAGAGFSMLMLFALTTWPFGRGPDRRQAPEHTSNCKHHRVGNKLPQTTPNHSRCFITEVSMS